MIRGGDEAAQAHLTDEIPSGETAGDEPAESGADCRRRSGEVPALAVEGLTTEFGDGDAAVRAVDGVSFDIESGTIVGLLGPNGAGKTTLIKSILGMVLPDGGEVRIDGIDPREAPRKAYAKTDAMLEGARNDYWRLTTRENLRYFATISGVKPDSVAGRQQRLLERFELTDKADVPVRDLSRGMKQKVSLASVLAGGAELVFLDEPTLGLDVESSNVLRRELRRLVADENLTVVLSSHDMDSIEAICDRVLVMHDGGIIADDSVERFVQSREIGHVRFETPSISRSVVDEIRRRFDVREITADAGHTVVEARVDSREFYRLVALLERAELTLTHLSTDETDLEETFLALTSDRSAT